MHHARRHDITHALVVASLLLIAACGGQTDACMLKIITGTTMGTVSLAGTSASFTATSATPPESNLPFNNLYAAVNDATEASGDMQWANSFAFPSTAQGMNGELALALRFPLSKGDTIAITSTIDMNVSNADFEPLGSITGSALAVTAFRIDDQFSATSVSGALHVLDDSPLVLRIDATYTGDPSGETAGVGATLSFSTGEENNPNCK